MKRILISLFTISAVSALTIGATFSYFSDVETISGNTIQTGTVDIEVNGENPWTRKFEMENMEPGEEKEISLTIHNTGEYPVKLWKIIKNLETEENGIVEPEQDWYETNNGGQPKNDIDTAMVYEMYIDGKIAVEKEAGITLSEIKDYHMGLVKLDKAVDPSYTGPNPNGSGILNPGGSITVVQKYHFKADTGNWAQSDKMTFDIKILARQVSAPEPVKQLSFLNNKNTSSDWSAIADSKIGLLKYNSIAPTLDYDFSGVGLDPAEQYCLIYSKDPWTGGKKILIEKGMSDANGKVSLAGSMDTDDLPHADDGNYPTGAKIWSLPCDDYNESGQSIGWPPHADWLFENWPGFINYTKGETPDEPDEDDDPPGTETESVKIDEVMSSTDWTGETRDYSLSDVNFSYENPADGRLSGKITASGLKPYTTYQMKFIGKPTCDGAGGNDAANEYIGYKGRWTVLNSSCTGFGVQPDGHPIPKQQDDSRGMHCRIFGLGFFHDRRKRKRGKRCFDRFQLSCFALQRRNLRFGERQPVEIPAGDGIGLSLLRSRRCRGRTGAMES